MKKWRCKLCGYVYETCPLCGAPASQFELIEDE